ncbi:MAG: hypothetical protein H6641_09695 [Caldilineaceae bacterium]|nr:hypothetical protein [Caldilineaceae bacterium]
MGKLPDRRVELYASYVRTLINNRAQQRSHGARQLAVPRFDPTALSTTLWSWRSGCK